MESYDTKSDVVEVTHQVSVPAIMDHMERYATSPYSVQEEGVLKKTPFG